MSLKIDNNGGEIVGWDKFCQMNGTVSNDIKEEIKQRVSEKSRELPAQPPIENIEEKKDLAVDDP